jgi:hypothetical protein
VISAMNGKVEEYARKLEEYEQKKAEKAAKLDVKALVQSSREIRRVEVEGLGVVEYGVLTLADSLELAKCKTPEERGVMTLWLMLQKADKDLTLDEVKALPLDVAAKLMTALTRDMGFLAGKPLTIGSEPTKTPST